MSDEAYETVTKPFAVQEGNWKFDPFIVKAMLPISDKQQVPMWVQVQNRGDLDIIKNKDPLLYGRKFTVAVRKSTISLLPEGIEIQVKHNGTGGTITLDVDWFKASLYVARREEYSTYLPSVKLIKPLVQYVNAVISSNEGTHPKNTFSNNFFE